MKVMQRSTSAVPLRPPKVVMRLARLGSFHQCRLSFMRVLLRRLKREAWTFDRPVFDIDAKGVGVAVYSAHGPERSYSLVCFAHDLPADQRSDRVIAEAWDSTFTLFDGVPGEDDIERLSWNVPKQEMGRITSREICLSRANRSVRLFDHVVERLAAGQQPDREKVAAIGYLMRTTAVYGSGKFGAADREAIADRPEFKGPFQAEMLSVYLTRTFVLDLVEHMARARSSKSAVRIAPALRRWFGVGNSTGLGMAPFIVNHPALLNNWICSREQALARVRGLAKAEIDEIAAFKKYLVRARDNAEAWSSEHSLQIQKLTMLRADLSHLEQHVAAGNLEGETPWDRLYRWSEDNLSIEGQEQLVSLMLEPYGALVDDLAECMDADEDTVFRIDGSMPLKELRAIVDDVYRWALVIDWTSPESLARVWYISEEKLEPRLGGRFEEPIEPYEQPLAPGRDAAGMARDIDSWNDEPSVAAFLLVHPEHRHIARRAQIAKKFPYAEIRDNTISSALLPIDLLRCKLSFFGATHFDPRSDRWVRINMFRDAPFPVLAAPADREARAAPAKPLVQAEPAAPDGSGEHGVQVTRPAARRSLNEVEAMGKRAARGAGLSWGIAEEAGKAVRWLTARGLPGAEQLADLLALHDQQLYAELAPMDVDGVWQAPAGRLCPLIAGAALCDRAAEIADGRLIELGTTAQPLLLASYAADAAKLTGTAILIAWDDMVITLAPEGEVIDGNRDALTARSTDGVRCRFVDEPAAPVNEPAVPVDELAAPVDGLAAPAPAVDAVTWSRLLAFAQRTFAPATEASRLSGAGAGLSDNN